jgi:gluconolactonase
MAARDHIMENNQSGRKQMHRRAFLTATAAAATAATFKSAQAVTERPYGATGVPLPARPLLPLGPLPGSRYPDPHIESLDKRFKGSPGTGAVERIATGFRWAEGPVYFPAGRYLLFSDIPNNRIMRLSEDDNHLSVFREPSMNSNGNTIDREGRLVTCEHGGRRVTRTELDGSITIIADKYNNKKLNAPNDVAVASNGTIWFTDPGYGIKGDYEGLMEPFEQEKKNVFRVDPKTGDIKVVVDDFVMPNGITFSPDEKKLYVIDTGLTEGPNNPAHIRVFDVDIDVGAVSNGKVFADNFSPGFTDGMRCDTDGNVWCSMGWADPKEDGVRCYAPDGTMIGKIHVPETVANLTFGGMRRNRLYICGSTSLYACYTSARGALKP